MKIRLEHAFVLDLYCCVRQAALSLDRALSPAEWTSLLAYYDPRRRAWVASMPVALKASLGPPSETPYVERIRPRMPGRLSTAIATLVGRFRRSIRVSRDEAYYLVQTLTDLLRMLNSEVYPGTEALTALRLELSSMETLLAQRGGSMPGLDRCRIIEHFNQAPQIRTLSISSVHELAEPPTTPRAQPV